MDVLIIDNNDSFTRNLEHLLVAAIDGATVAIAPYAALPDVDLTTPDLIVISPGPGEPAEYPGYERVFSAGKPVLGICLGMQIINEHAGGTTGRLTGCVHGKTDTIRLNGIERVVARYHSLRVQTVGSGLTVLAENRDSIPMCLGNRDDRILGYQFHPESFLTPYGGWFIEYALDFLSLS
ncbi:aminodeoxychorismate/anthranilate synthase component II [Pseudodesulfovibrio sediminis]|uniref:Glutamine amidotransferase n=1 Tax=Pseudodesulfovibrio sediminis TaxID=2810563 RepID=A0ABN6EUX3_9BACT|nr:aminodeoxychorismate/anthranilate synthase component II [Pseudodesulfovibrio sediminis]BCS89059.1 glutamine amidotransferase [Pseudodesulfovibrio sediminis]